MHTSCLRRNWKDCGGTYDCKSMGQDYQGITKNSDANESIKDKLKSSERLIARFGSFVEQMQSLKLEYELLDKGIVDRRMEALQEQSEDPTFVKDSIICLLKNRFLMLGMAPFFFCFFEPDDAAVSSGTPIRSFFCLSSSLEIP